MFRERLTLTITDPAQGPTWNSQQYDPSITHIYVTVSGFLVHVAGQGNSSGWNTMPISRNHRHDKRSRRVESPWYDEVLRRQIRLSKINVTAVTVEFVSGTKRNYTVPADVESSDSQRRLPDYRLRFP